MTFGPEYILQVAPDSVVKCAACEAAIARVKRLGLDVEIRPGEFQPGAVCADKRLFHALHVYWFTKGEETPGGERFPDGAPVLIDRRLREVSLDAADFAELGGAP
jgi:hypothetical protein